MLLLMPLPPPLLLLLLWNKPWAAHPCHCSCLLAAALVRFAGPFLCHAPSACTTAAKRGSPWPPPPASDSQHMFVPLEPLLAASSAQQACQALHAPVPGASSSNRSSDVLPLSERRYAHPIDGACPLTGAAAGKRGTGEPRWAVRCGPCVVTAVDRAPFNPAAPHCLALPPAHCTQTARRRRPAAPHPPLALPTCPLPARKLPAFTALRARQLFVASCPNGASEFVESRAAMVSTLACGLGSWLGCTVRAATREPMARWLRRC